MSSDMRVPSSSSLMPTLGFQRRVLIVEDSEFVHQIYRVAFRKLGGCELFHANDGTQGLILLEQKTPIDLIILDINMPVMDGYSFIRSVKGNDRYSHIHILVVSTEDMEGKIREAIRAGAGSYLQKPFDLDEIVALLQRVVPTLSRRNAS